MLSFGDPGPFVKAVRRAGTRLIVQVTDLDEAKRALDLGADVIVVQGSEAGGHGSRRTTLTDEGLPPLAPPDASDTERNRTIVARMVRHRWTSTAACGLDWPGNDEIQ